MSLTPPMDQKVKADWVAALRSGKYKQTTGVMYRSVMEHHHPAGYCCLGVLASILGTPTWMLATLGCLPKEVAYEAGLGRYVDPRIMHHQEGAPSTKESLSCLNDQVRLGFPEIADIIEAQL